MTPNVFCSHNDINTLYRQVNNELSKLYTWFAINKLSLNVDKTNYMLFTNRSVESILDVDIDNVTIDRVYIAKFLGVFIDHKLSWKEHISKLCSKLSKCVALIYKASHVLSSNALYILYCTLFLPYLTYCVEVWGNTYKTNIIPIFMKQKRVIRMVCHANYLEHTSDLFKSLKALTVFQLIEFRTGLFMYKAYHKLLPANLQRYFSVSTNIYNTKQCGNSKQKRVRTKKKQLCISYSGVSVWNSINKNFRDCISLYSFKKKYKQYLISILP